MTDGLVSGTKALDKVTSGKVDGVASGTVAFDKFTSGRVVIDGLVSAAVINGGGVVLNGDELMPGGITSGGVCKSKCGAASRETSSIGLR